MPAPSLVTLCTKACIRNITSLRDVGDFEYIQIRTVLARISAPEQLREIEINSPQIKREDAELWRAFIARDIPDWKKKNYVPKNPEKWYEVYMKYKKEQSREIEADKERLKEAMMGLKKEKESHVSKKIDPRLAPKLPRDPRMRPNDGGVPIGKRGFAKAAPTTLNFSGGSKTKMTTGAGVLSRARREAKELSARNKLIKPTHQLVSTRIYQAPKGMISEHRKAAEPPVRIFTPKRNASGSNNSLSTTSDLAFAERERRLRALTQPKREDPSIVRPTVVDSDSDDFEDDDLDDLFDEKPAAPARNSYRPQETRHRPLPTGARPPNMASTLKPPSLPKHDSRPSDVINSMISNPKSRLATASSSLQDVKLSPPKSLPRNVSPRPFNNTDTPMRTSSPAAGIGRPTIPHKRKMEVDIFNRGGAAMKKVRR